MVQSLVDNGVVTDFDTFKAGIMNRSTNFNWFGWIAPAKMKQLKKSSLVCKIKQGGWLCILTWWPNNRLVLLWSHQKEQRHHWRPLAELSKYLMKPGFADKLRQASTPDQVDRAFDAEEQEAAAEEGKQKRSPKKRLHLTNDLSSLPLQHVQQGRPHLYGRRSPHQKVGNGKYRTRAWNQRGIWCRQPRLTALKKSQSWRGYHCKEIKKLPVSMVKIDL